MSVILGQTLWQYIKSDARPPGTEMLGGFLLCKNGGVAWIVAPSSTECLQNSGFFTAVRNCAETVTGCNDWFIPTRSQLSNPGYECRIGWDSYQSGLYWTSEAISPGYGWVNMANGSLGACYTTNSFYIRAFRCVTY
jgi:hypothetical protein